MSITQTKLNIRFYGDPILRGRSKPVLQITNNEKAIFSQMQELMKLSGGVGLAAPQVGINKQMVLVDIGQGPVMLINPKIMKKSGSERIEEGCLSLPGVYVSVKRARSIVVTAMNVDNQNIVLNAGGLLARVIQHEVDHLRGRMIIDYASVFTRIKLRRKLKYILGGDKT